MTNERIDEWAEEGSGMSGQRITRAYMNVARYQQLGPASFIDLPQKLKNKKAIINVVNKDQECLKWSLRAVLYPSPCGKNPKRPSSCPVDDGINYEGIDFRTPVKQIDKLEKQNKNLAINVFRWENECVVVHRIRTKEAKVPRIKLTVIEKGEKQHYCYLKRFNALLFDQTKTATRNTIA